MHRALFKLTQQTTWWLRHKIHGILATRPCARILSAAATWASLPFGGCFVSTIGLRITRKLEQSYSPLWIERWMAQILEQLQTRDAEQNMRVELGE